MRLRCATFSITFSSISALEKETLPKAEYGLRDVTKRLRIATLAFK